MCDRFLFVLISESKHWIEYDTKELWDVATKKKTTKTKDRRKKTEKTRWNGKNSAQMHRKWNKNFMTVKMDERNIWYRMKTNFFLLSISRCLLCPVWVSLFLILGDSIALYLYGINVYTSPDVHSRTCDKKSTERTHTHTAKNSWKNIESTKNVNSTVFNNKKKTRENDCEC